MILSDLVHHHSYTFGEKKDKTKERWYECMCCGKTNHCSDQCCILEKGLWCSNCDKKGHLAIVCQSKAKAQPLCLIVEEEDTNVDPDTDYHDGKEARIYPEVTPWLDMTIFHKEGQFEFCNFPDTAGASTMIFSDLVHHHSYKIMRLRDKMLPYQFKVVWLEGKSMHNPV